VREVAVTRCPVNDNTSLVLLAKSLSAGGAVANPSTSAGEGFPLRTEALEGDDEDEDELKKKKLKAKMTKSEAIDFLTSRNPRLSKKSAARIVEYAMQRRTVA